MGLAYTAPFVKDHIEVGLEAAKNIAVAYLEARERANQ